MQREEGASNSVVPGDETIQGSGVQELSRYPLNCKWVHWYMRGALAVALVADIDADVDIRHPFHLRIVITSIPSGC